MTTRSPLIGWLWRAAVGVAAVTAGQMLAVALGAALGLELPSAPGTVGLGTQTALFVSAATAIVVALVVMAVGLAGRWWERWVVLGAFIYGVYGIGNVIEASVFTTLGGEAPLAVMHLGPSVLGTLAVALLVAGPTRESFGERVAAFWSRWKPATLAARLGLALLAFPVFYFLFGAIVAPIVTPYYTRLDFLLIPPLPTMLQVLFIRSVLLLLVSLPVIIAWRASRGRLFVALSLGHFVAVGFAGLVQATFFPPVLRWAHGLEILADSICYSAALVWLLHPREAPAGGERAALQERLA